MTNREAEIATPEVSMRHLNNGILVIICLFLSVSAGTSLFGYSRDYFEYLIYYQSLPNTLSFKDTRFEPGFHLVAWLFRNVLDLDLSMLAVTLSVIALSIKFFLFRKYLSNPVLAALLYCVVFYPIHEYTQYRVGISLAFGYYAIHLLIEKKYFRFLIPAAIALSFHYSVILLFFGWTFSVFIKDRLVVALASIFLVSSTLYASGSIYLVEDILNRLNPLGAAYLYNKAMIESVSIFSVNNLLLLAALTCFASFGMYYRSEYHRILFVLTALCLVPIVLVPEAPVIAQRSKEVLFLSYIFLSCRDEIRIVDVPGLSFILAMTGLLGYLWIDGGIIFN